MAKKEIEIEDQVRELEKKMVAEVNKVREEAAREVRKVLTHQN